MNVSGLGFEATRERDSRARLDHTAFARDKAAQACSTGSAAGALTGADAR
jgi:hypothetical protein